MSDDHPKPSYQPPVLQVVADADDPMPMWWVEWSWNSKKYHQVIVGYKGETRPLLPGPHETWKERNPRIIRLSPEQKDMTIDQLTEIFNL